MKASLIHRASKCQQAFSSCSKRTSGRLSLCVRAEKSSGTPASKISRTDVRYTGYQEEDSYGLTNIFPVEVKTYEAGSAQDGQDTFNTPLAGVAFVVASAVIAGGLVVLGNPSTPGNVPESVLQYASLSEYKSKFVAELGIAKSAPSVRVEVVSAPAVEAAVVTEPTA